MTREELLSCPFCGGTNLTETCVGLNLGYVVQCCDCKAVGPRNEDGNKAYDLWNRRAPQPLKRWTAEMSTPPDGLYLNYVEPMGQVIIHADGRWKGEVYKPATGKAMVFNCDEETIFMMYPEVYGPIEPASGEPGGASND